MLTQLVSNSTTRPASRLLFALILATVAITSSAITSSYAQDTPTAESTVTEVAETAVESTAEAVETTTEAAAEAVTDTATEVAEKVASDVGEEVAEVEEAAGSMSLQAVLITIGIIALPILLGNLIAKNLRMPEQAWKLATMFLTLAIAGLAVATGKFKGGPDLAGGVTLVYEVANEPQAEPAEGEEPVEAAPKAKVDERLIGALKQRIDPSGTKEVSIREFGDVIEIIVPKAGPEDLTYLKRRITELGQLEFRITADPRWTEDQPLIEKALALSPSQKIVMVNERPKAEWVAYDENQFSANDPRLVQRTAGSRREALVLIDRYDVTGEYLSSAAKGVDEVGAAAVDFTLNASGGRRFGKLTGDNLPNTATGAYRMLGILIDKKLISAPRLNSRIENRGQITMGGDVDEVEFIVSILNAGSLPAALNKTPISEETVSPTLGATTIEKGRQAIIISLAAVLLFILFYYRFAGLVACFALAGTLLLVLGAMVIIQAAFTLPGLAGLVLTIGMAVDANVLIFERIREELAKGSSLRMAISNGFDRATTTIVDANVTTLITGIVLYSIGTDQIRGFAVTLVLGIIMSMFTAIFCSRIIFDIAERRRWIKSLNFSSIIGKTDLDFVGMRHIATAFSLLLIGIGMAGVYYRGEDLLNIDFTGGSSITMVLEEPEELSAVREKLLSTDLADKNLLVVERGETNTRYTINSSLEEVELAEDIITTAFGNELQTYELEIGTPVAFSEPLPSGAAEEAVGFEGTDIPLSFNEGASFGENDGLAHDPLIDEVQEILKAQGHVGMLPQLLNDDYTPGTNQLFKEWKLRLGLNEADSIAVANALRDSFVSRPVFPLANKIGSRVAGDLQQTAISAILVCLLGIVAYLWFRFQNVAFGLAAVVALIHDVLVTLGVIALSAFVVNAAPGLATALKLDAFQISLPIVAAFVTIIGYSLNDTIVVFDRIREVRGKSPDIKAAMVNKSVNQTLSRTLLTSLTTLIVVIILYLIGGAGIHGFAFSLVVGVLVGTYSSVFVASPALLWMTDRGLGKEELLEETN